ncbi:MAG: response regulator [Vicingaceae bacterium]|nr:response regulator [Vicingaceae bacterium]
MEQILIIEDDKNIRETLKDILELSGYNILTANNGKEGYHAILTNYPDLVLCDVNMPELDGFELLGAINQRLKEKIIPPFLFLTARVEKIDIRHGMSLGADDYILKPFNNNEVLKIIRLRLDARKKLLQMGEGNKLKENAESFNKLALPCADGLILVHFDKIIKCQADRAYCCFYLVDGSKILVSKPMSAFETILINKQFLKIHKSTIINPQFIDKYIRGKNGSLLLSDGSNVPVSQLNKEELLRVLNHVA